MPSLKITESILITLSLVLLKSVYAEIIEPPRNTITHIGERATLRCCSSHTNGSTFVWRKFIDSDLSHKICEGGKCPHHRNYEIEELSPGCSNLVIVSASVQDTTFYECIDGMGGKAGAYLIAYSCGANSSIDEDLVDGDVVTFRCAVTWQHAPRFHSYWRNTVGKIIKFKHFIEKRSEYESKWTVSLQRPELQEYTWVLHSLIPPNVADYFDFSTPDVTWTSKKKDVAYPVTSIQTSCQDNACLKGIGESITCSADGYPRPELSWLDGDGKEVSRGPSLTLNSTEKQKFTCVATNSIRGIRHRDSVSIVVLIKELETTCSSEIITYLQFISGALATTIIILIASVLYQCGPTVFAKLQSSLFPQGRKSVNSQLTETSPHDSKDQKDEKEHRDYVSVGIDGSVQVSEKTCAHPEQENEGP